jgi:hypothetical protein
MGGQFAIGLNADFNGFASVGGVDGVNSYGISLNANLEGPFSLEGGYQLSDFEDTDTNGNFFYGRVAYELPVAAVSVCPFAGAGYFKASEEEAGIEGSIELTTIPIGLGIGKRLAVGESANFDIFARPQFLYLDASAEVSGGDGGFFGVSDSETEFGADLGANIVFSSFYAGAGVFLSTIEDADPLFSVRLGVLVGGNR